MTRRTENEVRETEDYASSAATAAGVGPPSATPDHSLLTVHITCEVCHERLLVAAPRRSARYGAVDCPGCGTSYVFRLEPGRADCARDPSTTTADFIVLAAQ